MPPSREHGQQLTLAQGEQAQYGVVDAQLALPLELAEQAIAIVPRGLRAAAGNGAEQRRGAEGDAADHQVDAGTGRGTCGHATADLHAQLLEGLGVEQVVAPAPVE